MDRLGFLLSAALEKHRSRPALCINGDLISYQAMDDMSRRLAAGLRGQVVGILAGGSRETYAGVLAVARSGRTYVPLNAEFPDERLLRLMSDSGLDSLIVDRQHLDRARALLSKQGAPLRVVLSERDQDLPAKPFGPPHETMRVDPNQPPGASEPNPCEEVAHVDEATPLYMMTTSGSTGAPKKIAIPRSNVADYLRSMREQFDFGADDRFSQFFKLSFDLSVHDLFVAWTTGGCLHIPGTRDLLDPVAFARRHALTVWFSVPSLASLAIMARKLKPDELTDLRHVLFCGEALSFDVAAAFQAAAPHAELSNLYGPTEATIAITRHKLSRRPRSEGGGPASVPIGAPFPGQEAIVVGDDLALLPPGERGELLLGGSQLAPGYVDNPAQTNKAFLDRTFPGYGSERWYRTGDIVEETADGLTFLGRSDTQVKFRGHRIELGEIEMVLRRVAKTPLAVVIARPASPSGAISQLLAFVMPPHAPVQDVQTMMRNLLPSHMTPSRIISITCPLDRILNDNKKIDRGKIAEIYLERAS